MVCKEDVFAWFTKLKAPKRIEVLASLLHMCLPLELRFVGSCVENLAKRNFVFLREAENQANSVSEIDKLRDLTDETVRSRINVYLALLYSTNIQCSNVLFDILSTCVESAIPKLSMDEEIANELLLMLTVAVNHPVFTFEQREVLSKHLGDLVRLLGEYIQEEENCKDVACQAGEPLLPEENGCSKDAWCQAGESFLLLEPAYVQDIKVQGSQRRTEKEHEFCMQVTWSNGEVTAVNKTYQELYEFHTKLLKAFPDDAGAHRHERKIPYLPGIRHLQRNHREEQLKTILPNIQEYAEQLVKVPEYILHSDYLQVFFKPEPQNPASHVLVENAFNRNRTERTGADRSRHSSTGSTNSRQGFGNDAEYKEEVHPTSEYVRSATIYNSKHVDVGGRRIVEHHMGGIAGMAKERSVTPSLTTTTPTSYQRGAYTSGSVSPFSLSSAPLPSPLSLPLPFMSPPSMPEPDIIVNQQQHYNKQQQQRMLSTLHPEDATCEDESSLVTWLKSVRLHKYKDQLSKYSLSDLPEVTDEQLEEMGLAKGAISKLRKELQKIMPIGQGPNGMIMIDTGGSWRSNSPSSPSSPVSPSSYHTPPCHSPHMVAPPSGKSGNMAQVLPVGSCLKNFPNNSSVDSSPSCSEYSSPPPSPSIEGEDRERGKGKERAAQKRPGFVPISKSGLTESQIPENGLMESHTPGNGMTESQIPLGSSAIQPHLQETGLIDQPGPGTGLISDIPGHPVMESKIPFGGGGGVLVESPIPAGSGGLVDPQQVLVNGGIRPMYQMESGPLMHTRVPIMCNMRPIMKPTPVIPGRIISPRTPLSAPVPAHLPPGAPRVESPAPPPPGIHDYPTATSDVITVAASTMATMNTRVTTISATTVSVPSLQGVLPRTAVFNIGDNHGSRDSGSPVLHATAAHNYQPPPPLVSADSTSIVQTSQQQPKMASIPPSNGEGGVGGGSISNNNPGMGLLPTHSYPPSIVKTVAAAAASSSSNKSPVLFPPQQSVRSSVAPSNSSGGGCTQCGCHGNCGSNNNNNQQQHPAQYNYFMIPPLNNAVVHSHLPHGPAAGFIPQTPNGVVPPGIHHFGQQLPNGMAATPEGYQYYMSMLQAQAMHGNNSFINHSSSAPSLGAMQQHHQHHPQQQHHRSNKQSSKSVMCYNCGHQGHKAPECKEVTMDSITRSGLQLNYKPSE
ncbi:zinc finger CCHC domain-containing protein 14 [Lingula anatina]|uniref:Zinc finger CCHC domain-containing protein 14 n=1 Tax=Lingula anatina TaxID=7574 RepID=A0A1S3H3R6_LINAN|nr:zinc finger CCHC domain-containing protein 14 [Lingula anatina]|eukprot:XP_013380648.1 zinc finger CCHC domain-containing protein 14 [Lingula anatina]